MAIDIGNELLHKVQHAVAQNGHLRGMHGKTVEYRADGADVTIDGEVESYFQAQMAQEVLRNIEGIGKIQNNLRVSIPMPMSMSEA